MFNPRTKYKVSMITCNEEMKANAYVKIFVLSHPLGDLGVHLWLDGKRIDFLLAIIELFSLALTAATCDHVRDRTHSKHSYSIVSHVSVYNNNNKNLSISPRQYKASKLVHNIMQHAHNKTTLC